ncbi:MAG: protein kinase [Planctomycetes bacterium]|nr:protein kinase [Planctomycetota bacterium]
MKLGKIAVDRSWLNYRQLREVLDRQEEGRSQGLLRRLGEMLVADGLLNAQQVRELLAAQGVRIQRCQSCETFWNVRGEPGSRGRCGACGTVLSDATKEPPISVVGEVRTRPADGEVAAEPGQETVQLASGFSALAGEPPADAQGVAPGVGGAIEAGGGASARRGSQRYEIKLMYPVQGGMGRLYLARDLELNRMVLMKVLREDLRDPEAVRRFVTEAQVTAQLQHPNIVPVYDLAVDEAGLPFYTMKQVVGQSFRDVVGIPKGQPTDHTLVQMLQILQAVCNAVHFAHTQGVVHRDLKPGNILVGAFGEVVVVDWGLAKIVGRDDASRKLQADIHEALESVDRTRGARAADMRTLAGTTLGTPAYMAPEQARGEISRLGPAADIFALGAILYEVLTCRPPYTGRNSRDILQKVLRGPPPPPRAIDPEVPPELEAICLKCMEPEPTQRYATVGELRNDLQAVIEGRDVKGTRVGWRVRARRFLQRHAVPVRITEAAAVLMTVFGWVYTLQWESAREVELRFGERQEASLRALERARRDLEALHQDVSRDREVRTRLGMLEARLALGGDVGEARRGIERVCREHPAEGAAWALLGRLAAREGRWEDALHAFAHAAEDASTRLEAGRARLTILMRLGDEPGANAMVEEIAREDPAGPEAGRRSAFALLGRLGTVRQASDVRREVPRALDALEAWGNAYGEDRLSVRARVLLESARTLAEAEAFVDALGGRADAGSWRESPGAVPLMLSVREARARADGYLRERAEDVEVREVDLLLAQVAGDGEGELRALDALLVHRYADASLWRAIAQKAAALDLDDRAESVAARMVQSDPQNVEIRHWRALLRHAMGRYEPALVDLDWVCSVRPELPQPFLERGRILMDLERFPEAETVFTGLLRDPAIRARWPEAWHQRGLSRERQGNREGAAADYGEAARLAPREARYSEAWRRVAGE